MVISERLLGGKPGFHCKDTAEPTPDTHGTETVSHAELLSFARCPCNLRVVVKQWR